MKNENNSCLLRNIGKTITDMRLEQKLTQMELSKLSGIGYSTLRKLESDNTGGISLQTLDKITNALNISLPLFLLRALNDENDKVAGNKDQYSAYNKAVFESLYPPNLFDYKVTSLLQFAVYLPLFDLRDILDILSFFNGSFLGQEEYFLKRINKAIAKIPDSKAKDYADMRVADLLEQQKNNTLLFHARNEDEEKFEECCNAYLAKIEEIRKLNSCLAEISQLANVVLSPQG